MGIESTAAVIGVLINLAVAFLMYVTVREMRKTMYAQAYQVVLNTLQDEDVRSHRRKVFTSLGNEEGNPTKQYQSWSADERMSAEIVCHTYDTVGQMIRAKLIPPELVADSWGNSLRRSWRILEPLVLDYREKWDSWEVWDDFEWLAKQAESYRKTKPGTQTK